MNVLRIFWYLAFGQVVYWNGENIPQTLRKKYTTFSTERLVALRSVKKFQESYDFSASNKWEILDGISESESAHATIENSKMAMTVTQSIVIKLNSPSNRYKRNSIYIAILMIRFAVAKLFL
jgi:hypothetical protein